MEPGPCCPQAHAHVIVELEGLPQVAGPPAAPDQHGVVALKGLESLLLQHLSLKQVQGLSQLGKRGGGDTTWGGDLRDPQQREGD